jgi:uncharacterized protein with NRDE domain
MCLILFAHKVHPVYPLVLAANRDELYTRATAPAAFWDDQPNIYGGRDLEQGGSWLAITRGGRIAAVTNYRDGNASKTSVRSRGALVTNFLRGAQPASDYANRLLGDAHAFNGFNLIAGDPDALFYVSNRDSRVTAIAPGIHGLSNHLLNTPWPKVERGKATLATLINSHAAQLVDALFDALADHARAPDNALPNTGVGLERERLLSAAFIKTTTYGTRSSTVVLIDNHGQVTHIERSFDHRGAPGSTITGRFALEPASANSI